jgi:hypothetical protein
MSNTLFQFSEEILDLPSEAINWLKRVLDKEVSKPELLELLGLSDLDFECWPGFDWEIDGSTLWIMGLESFDEDNLTIVLQKLIKRFIPEYIFCMTWSTSSSSHRLREFGGGWIIISKDKIRGGDVWTEAKKMMEGEF